MDRIPNHIAIIMDGNGRWAKKRGQPRYLGHKAGVDAVRRVMELCGKLGVQYLSLFAFSSENWQRPKKEVHMLMKLFYTALNREIKRMERNGVRLKVIGDLSVFSEKLQALIRSAEERTQHNRGLFLQVAANYGGRWDIVQSCRRIAQQVKTGQIEPEQIDIELFHHYLAFQSIPDPDLFIRTGGEKRISNFMLWQLAYTELYFTDQLWPDFSEADLMQSLADYAKRQRRFGRIEDSHV